MARFARKVRIGWLLVALLGCQRSASCGTPALAELVQKQGDVVRDYLGREQRWEAADSGASFAFGDGLRTGHSASAELRVGDGRVLVESETIIRFLPQPGAAANAPPGVQITQGSATLEASASELHIRTRAGVAVLKAGTRVELRPSADGERYRVVMGSADFAQADGHTVTANAGQSVAIGIGLAVLDEVTNANGTDPRALTAVHAAAAEPATAAVDAAVPSPATDADAPAGARDAEQADVEPEGQTQVLADERGDAAADLQVPVGEAFRIYDPHPPTSLKFALSERCAKGGELSFDGHAAVRSSHAVVVQAPTGSHAYVVRCLDARGRAGRSYRGSFRVLRSDGARPLPKTAPHDSIDLDGHKYRLMYQNLRPLVTARWVSPPQAAAYVLTVQAPAGTPRVFRTPEPEYVLGADVLGDGKHVLTMEAQDKSKTRTKPTTVDIEFDNASPTASVELPPPDGFASGEPVEIRGIAVEGSSVSVAGQPVSLDRKRVFALTLTAPAGATALAIRIQHPAHGVRYFLRRAVSAH